MFREIAFLAEVKDGGIDGVSFQILTKAREVADSLGGTVTAIILGYNVEDKAKQLLDSGVDYVFLADNPILKYRNTELYANIIQSMLKKHKPTLLLLGHTYVGIEVASILGERLNASIATNCEDVRIADGQITIVKPVCHGKLRMEARVKHSDITILTMQPGALQTRRLQPRSAKLIRFDVESGFASRIRTQVIDIIMPSIEDVDISKSETIIAVGRGVQRRENLTLIEELTKTVGGAIACSRPLADLRWLPETRVVGTSGKTVKPKLYIALGISGALQHIVGMKDSQVIVAINKDPGAPIFNYAHYGIVEDMFKVLPILIEECRKMKKELQAS